MNASYHSTPPVVILHVLSLVRDYCNTYYVIQLSTANPDTSGPGVYRTSKYPAHTHKSSAYKTKKYRYSAVAVKIVFLQYSTYIFVGSLEYLSIIGCSQNWGNACVDCRELAHNNRIKIWSEYFNFSQTPSADLLKRVSDLCWNMQIFSIQCYIFCPFFTCLLVCVYNTQCLTLNSCVI